VSLWVLLKVPVEKAYTIVARIKDRVNSEKNGDNIFVFPKTLPTDF